MTSTVINFMTEFRLTNGIKTAAPIQGLYAYSLQPSRTINQLHAKAKKQGKVLRAEKISYT